MKRICKAAQERKYNKVCEHSGVHEQTTACFIRCCDVVGKDVRCIISEQL